MEKFFVEESMRGVSGALIGFLCLAVLILGYLYYRETSNDVTLRINLPNVEIQKK